MRKVVTRSREQASHLSEQLAALGAEVLEIPAIKLATPTHKQPIVDALLELNSYDWLVFTSPNGVTAFFGYFFKRFHDLRELGGARLAAVGPATAAKLRELHLQVDLTPNEALASEIAAAFAKFSNVENLKICLLRAEWRTPTCPRRWKKMGAIVDDIACYRTVPENRRPQAGAAARLQESGADWITFTSGSTVEYFHARFNLPQLTDTRSEGLSANRAQPLAVVPSKPSKHPCRGRSGTAFSAGRPAALSCAALFPSGAKFGAFDVPNVSAKFAAVGPPAAGGASSSTRLLDSPRFMDSP